jgi:hypothetical protein
MQIVGRKILEKTKRKNLGNTMLSKAIDKLLDDLEKNDLQTEKDVLD